MAASGAALTFELGAPALQHSDAPQGRRLIVAQTLRVFGRVPGPPSGAAAYNRTMFESLHAMLAPAAAERLTLVINHVLGGEPQATDRLRPHASRTLALTLTGWPRLLPPPPALAWRITPAGLLDWCGAIGVDAPDLSVQIDASNPALLVARALGGKPPPVQIDGDAQLAGDVNWLLQNVRWDVAADLERLFGPVVAQQLHQLGRAIAGGMRTAIRTATEIADRLRSRQS